MTLSAQSLPDRYGNRKVPKMVGEIKQLRSLIRAQGTQDIQDQWDRIEPYIDFLFQEAGKRG